LKELNDQYLIIKSRAQNGVILFSAADSFKKQILEIEQQILSTQLDREAVLIMLGKWIGQPINPTSKLNVPEVDITPATELNRPELRLFDQQHLYLETMKGLSNAKRRPVVSAFAQAGVGQPNAFNLLETDFSDFYIVGVKLQWKLLDFGNAKREKGIYTANQEIVQTKKQDLENNLDRMLDKEKADIKKLNLLIEKDKELVALQNNIVRRSFTQLENGVITPQDYLSELNSRTQLELTNQIHEVQLQQAQINYLTISGNL
jgi:outer membrane protein TolC